MSLSKSVLLFLFWFALIYGGLIFPWPGWNALYSAGFRSGGNAIFGSSAGNRLLYFESHRQTQGLASIDTRIVLGNRDLADSSGTGPVQMLGIDPRSVSWVPTALTIALIAATPIPWQRRAWALLWGLVLIHLFIAFSIGVYIWNASTEVSLIILSPFWKEIAEAMQDTLVTQMGISFTVPVLIWVLVTFRWEPSRRIAKAPSHA